MEMIVIGYGSDPDIWLGTPLENIGRDWQTRANAEIAGSAGNGEKLPINCLVHRARNPRETSDSPLTHRAPGRSHAPTGWHYRTRAGAEVNNGIRPSTSVG